jgi:Uncharacterised nucleotidyltransferase
MPFSKVVSPLGEVDREANSHLLAVALAGAWRLDPPPMGLSSQELERVLPLLEELGGGALGWWRIGRSDPHVLQATSRLHDDCRSKALAALIREQQVMQVCSLLRSSGVEPLLLKGWAVARLYPQSGLRPLGADIDLLIRPDQAPLARRHLP